MVYGIKNAPFTKQVSQKLAKNRGFQYKTLKNAPYNNKIL